MAEQVRVVVFQEGDAWVAQCLEYDIGAQANDTDRLYQRLLATLISEYQESKLRGNGEPFDGIEPAPQRFHEMWTKKRSGVFAGTLSLPINHRDVTVELALCA
ncbi:hypothetical protein [Magnetospirillum sp. UT-4]|uniref:hypothetical protein n=1 Tax=Magnetospirillum sp. UT-4 TaxID=2681467 RepID=UPI00137CAFD0|nr:hypothetical protein [Magnetospirillum sp. UT-4]CAA7617639.1 conserved hypothetical protein [Magnetospirillum sp. UT-4]